MLIPSRTCTPTGGAFILATVLKPALLLTHPPHRRISSSASQDFPKASSMEGSRRSPVDTTNASWMLAQSRVRIFIHEG